MTRDIPVNNDVILVDSEDRQIGTEEKLKAHRNGGKLHRAITVLTFNDRDELLIQRRAHTKHHARNLWAPTCCSHPAPREDALHAAHRRLRYEMGFDCDMKEIFTILYDVPLEDGMAEKEYDHVFFSRHSGNPTPNPEEVSEWRWVRLDDLIKDMRKNSRSYAPWFLAMKDDIVKNYDFAGR